MEIANIYTTEWAEEQEHGGFQIRGAEIGVRVGAELIGGSVYELDPGKRSGRTTSITQTRNG